MGGGVCQMHGHFVVIVVDLGKAAACGLLALQLRERLRMYIARRGRGGRSIRLWEKKIVRGTTVFTAESSLPLRLLKAALLLF